jgi:lipopolysaccharide/colanic/teichoic acid biosynthesis glycosyltransferase
VLGVAQAAFGWPQEPDGRQGRGTQGTGNEGPSKGPWNKSQGTETGHLSESLELERGDGSAAVDRTLVWPRVDARRRQAVSSARIVDLLVVVLLLPLLVVPMAIIALAVLLDSPGPVFYRARRIGFGGGPFEMVKFRTMKAGNAGSSVAGATDLRITPVGGFLRSSRLDELPQLWNVLRGEMSLVGPRPELEEFVALHADDYDEILSVPPGITGPTQLSYAGLEPHLLSLHSDPDSYYRDILLPDKVKLDLEYARSKSLAADLTILCRTLLLPLALSRRAGAAATRLRFSVLAGGLATAVALLLVATVVGSPR